MNTNQGPKKNPKPKKAHEQYQRMFWTIRGRYPIKQGFSGKSHQKAHPKVRQNLCRKSSLAYLFCPWTNTRKQIENLKGRQPTQKATHLNKNSLRKQFAQTLLPLFCLFSWEKWGQFVQTVRTLFAQTALSLGGWSLGMGLPPWK